MGWDLTSSGMSSLMRKARRVHSSRRRSWRRPRFLWDVSESGIVGGVEVSARSERDRSESEADEGDELFVIGAAGYSLWGDCGCGVCKQCGAQLVVATELESGAVWG